MDLLCGKCGRSLRVDDAFMGASATCPHCRADVAMPAPEGLAPEPISTEELADEYLTRAKLLLRKKLLVQCGSCSQRLTVDMKLAGKTCRCPCCGQMIQIPRQEYQEEPAPPAGDDTDVEPIMRQPAQTPASDQAQVIPLSADDQLDVEPILRTGPADPDRPEMTPIPNHTDALDITMPSEPSAGGPATGEPTAEPSAHDRRLPPHRTTPFAPRGQHGPSAPAAPTGLDLVAAAAAEDDIPLAVAVSEPHPVRRWLIAVGAVLLLGGAAVGVWLNYFRPPDRPSVGVVPPSEEQPQTSGRAVVPPAVNPPVATTSAPVVVAPPPRAIAASIAVDSVETQLVTADDFPAPAGQLFLEVTLSISAGSDGLKIPVPKGVTLKLAGGGVACLGLAGGGPLFSPGHAGTIQLEPKGTADVRLVFAVPESFGDGSVRLEGLGEVLISAARRPMVVSPAMASGQYTEARRLLKLDLSDRWVDAIRAAGPLTLELTLQGESTGFKLPACGISGSADVGQGDVVSLVPKGKTGQPWQLRITPDWRKAVLYLSNRPGSQIVFHRAKS